MTSFFVSILDRSKTCPNERIASSLNMAIKSFLMGVAVLSGLHIHGLVPGTLPYFCS